MYKKLVCIVKSYRKLIFGRDHKVNPLKKLNCWKQIDLQIKRFLYVKDKWFWKYAILTPTGRDINMMIQIHNQLQATRFIYSFKRSYVVK